MRNSDESIEKVLAGLRDSEPPAGMERRIFEAIQSHTTQQGAGNWWQSLQPTSSRLSKPRLLLAAATIAVLVFALVLPKTNKIDIATAPSLATAPVLPQPPTVSSVVTDTKPPAKSRALASAQPEHVRPARNEDSLAMTEMNAPSHPAPPLPLTKQEKLLLQVVNKGDPVELAMLNPEVRSKQIAESREEFRRFFGPAAKAEAQ